MTSASRAPLSALVEGRQEVTLPRMRSSERDGRAQRSTERIGRLPGEGLEEHARLERGRRDGPREPATACEHAGQRDEGRAQRDTSTASERVLADRLLDAIEERLPELGERELGLDLGHVDRGDGLLDAPDDRDLADLEDALLLLGRPLRRLVLRPRVRGRERERDQRDARTKRSDGCGLDSWLRLPWPASSHLQEPHCLPERPDSPAPRSRPPARELELELELRAGAGAAEADAAAACAFS